MPKTLIVIPSSSNWGGVTSFYANLKTHWPADTRYFEYRTRRSRSALLIPWLFICNVFSFLKTIHSFKPVVICLNPSMGTTALLRDGLFLLLAKCFKCKIVVFNHGWNVDFISRLKQHRLFFYRSVFFKADRFIVLANVFADCLRQWGYDRPIHVLTTCITDDFWDNAEKGLQCSQTENDSFRILFLTRIEKMKGIEEALQAFDLFRKRNPDKKIEMVCAGAGPELDYWKDYAAKNRIPASFPGLVTGTQKDAAFAHADCYLLPSYTEGLPTTVLEAMAWKLPIIVHLVGGLKDFFQPWMGRGTDSLSPAIYAGFLDEMLHEDRSRIGKMNRDYIRKNVLSSIVSHKMTNIFCLTTMPPEEMPIK